MLVVSGLAVAACGSSGDPAANAASESRSAATTVVDGAPTTTTVPTGSSGPAPETTTTIDAVVTPTARELTADEVSAALGQLVEADDCPVGFDQLRMLEVPYWSFEGTTRRGTLIVNADVAEAVLGVFEQLHASRFPIQRMEAIDPLPVDDTSRVSSNITVAFKCRSVRGGSSWSQHAYGRAVDINPVDNPSVTDGVATPPLGADRIDRGLDAPGMIHEGDEVTRLFDGIGWGWGGRWSSHQDYMHFSVNGQ